MSMDEQHPKDLVAHLVNPQANLPIRCEEEEGCNATPSLFIPHFFKGEPEALGAAQIFVGVLILVIGAALLSVIEASDTYLLDTVVRSGMPFWSGLLYIVSGSLLVAAAVKPTMGKVKASLTLNIMSALAAFIAMILLLTPLSHSIVSTDNQNLMCRFQLNELCKADINPQVLLNGVICVILVFTVLMFCITIASSVFGCKTSCRTGFREVNIVLCDTTSKDVPDTTDEDLTLSLGHLTSTNPIIIHGSSAQPQDY